MNNKPLDDFEDDFLPFSPVDEDTDNSPSDDFKEEKLDNSTIDENLSIFDDINTIESSVSNLQTSEKQDLNISNEIIDNVEDVSNKIEEVEEKEKTNDTDTVKENQNIFDDNASIENNFQEVQKAPSKKKQKKSIFNKKGVILQNLKILPVLAFCFVSVLGIYIFINNVKADVVNLIKIEENSKVGYINNEGNVVVKPKYLFGTDYYKGYAVVKNYNNLYGVLDGKGNDEIPFGNIFSATLYGDKYIVSKFTNEGLKMGLLDSNLKEVTRFIYDNLSYSKSGVFMFTKGETMGLLNSKGKEIYTYKVDEVDDRNISIEVSDLQGDSTSDIYAKIKINESSTIINTNTGKEVYKYTLDDIRVLDNNVFYIKDDSGNNRYFVIKDDKVIYETSEYKRIRIENLDSNIVIGIKENSDIDYINLLTKTKINDNGNIKYTYSDGVILSEAYDFASNKTQYTISIPDKTLGTFSDIDPVDDTFVNDYMKVNTENKKYSFLNKKGEFITKKEYESASDFNKNGFSIVSNDGQYGVINTKGKEIIKLKYNEISMIDEDLFKTIKRRNNQELFIFKEDNKYGIINSDEKVVVKPIYDDFEFITTKYPIIKANYNNETILINIDTLKELSIKTENDIEIYDNYIVTSNGYYNYEGELIYTIGG